jgi:glycerate kinase
VIALAGAIRPGAEAVLNEGITAYIGICSRPMTLDDALRDAAALVQNAAEQAVRAFLGGRPS